MAARERQCWRKRPGRPSEPLKWRRPVTSPSVSDRITSYNQPNQIKSIWSVSGASQPLLLLSSSDLIGVMFFFSLSLSDHTEIPHPSDKMAPPPEVLMQEEICSEMCQSEEPFMQSVGGLAEVPPLLAFYSGGCSCHEPPERPGQPQSIPPG